MKTREPEAGYDFPAKQLYREHVYRLFQKHGLRPTIAPLLLLPGREGLEIPVAQKAGYLLDNMHAVDQNPAIAATLHRKYPELNVYGVNVARAMPRIFNAGVRLRVLNLDFTTCWSESLARELAFIGSFLPMRDEQSVVVAITLLRGREQRAVLDEVAAFREVDAKMGALSGWGGQMSVMGQPSPNDYARLHEAFCYLSNPTLMHFDDWRLWGFYRMVGAGVYPSVAGSQTMVYGVAELWGVSAVPAPHVGKNRRLDCQRYFAQQDVLVRIMLVMIRRFLLGEIPEDFVRQQVRLMSEGDRRGKHGGGVWEAVERLGAADILKEFAA